MTVIAFVPPTGKERQNEVVQVRIQGADTIGDPPRFREVKARRCNDVWAITPWLTTDLLTPSDMWAVTHLPSGLKLNFVPLTVELAETIYLHVHHMNERGPQRETSARLVMLGVRDWIAAQLTDAAGGK